jgi:hypothetical protein
MRAWLIARSLGLAFGMVALGMVTLPAQAAPNVGQRVTFSGCMFAGTPATCLMIKSPDGTVYNINALNPRPRALDRVIRVRGTVTDKVSICNQGIVLDRIRWSRTRQRCPN